MGISKSIKNIFGKTKKKKDDVAIGGITTGGVATHSDAVKSPKTKPKNRNRVRLSKNKQFLWQKLDFARGHFRGIWDFLHFLLEQNFVKKKIFGKEFYQNRILVMSKFSRTNLWKDFSRISRDFGCSDVRNWIFGKSSMHLNFRCLDTWFRKCDIISTVHNLGWLTNTMLV